MHRLLDFFELKPPPSDLLADNITTETADLSWTENGTATSWEIRLGETGFDTTGVTPIAVTENPYTAMSLNPDTDYDFYVRSDYGSGVFTDWTGPYTFTTLLGLPTQQMQKLLAGDGTTGANFGHSVFLSGNYAIIGAKTRNADMAKPLAPIMPVNIAEALSVVSALKNTAAAQNALKVRNCENRRQTR